MEEAGCVWSNSSLNSNVSIFWGSRDNQTPPFSNFGKTPFDKIQWVWVTHFLSVYLLPINHQVLAFCEFFSSLFTPYSLCHWKAGTLLWKLLLTHVWKLRRSVGRQSCGWYEEKTTFSQRNLGFNMLFTFLVCNLDKWFKFLWTLIPTSVKWG